MTGGKHFINGYKPVNVFRNNVKLAGWHNETKTGESVEFTGTYDDFAEVEINGKTEQTQTTELISNPISQHIIPFHCGAGAFDMAHSGMTNAKWLYNGILYVQSRLQLTTLDDEVVWLLTDGFSDNSTINNNSVTQPIKSDLSDLQGKITYYLSLYNCTQITGSLADLQGKITYYLRLTNCNKITGSLADLQGKITYYLSLAGCTQITGSLADLQGKITNTLSLTNCNQITGSLADLQGKITYYLSLAGCTQITGSLADLQGKITYYLSLYNCTQITGSLADLQGKITNTLNLAGCTQITGSLADLQGKITYYLSLYNCTQITGSLADLQGKITNTLNLAGCTQITGSYIPVGSGVPTTTYLDNTGISPQDMDTTLIAYANTTKSNGTFIATGMARTSASNDAVNTLISRGWTVTGMEVI